MCWGVGDSFCVLGGVMKDGINWTHDDAALFNEILNLLGPEPPTCCGCAVEWQAAIHLIRKRLDLCPKCGSDDIRVGHVEASFAFPETSCRFEWGHE